MSSGGLRKVKRNRYVTIPNETVRDARLSFRARGVLTYLLSHDDGWDVRSEQIARDGKEGREAIRTALRELGERGYYRLERRRAADGRVLMNTAVADYAVDAWIKEWEEFGGGPVPMVQQHDGSYAVKHVDGTLELDLTSDEVTGDGFSGPGEAPQTGDGFPGAGSPDAGSPDSGSPGPFRRTITEDNHQTPTGSVSPNGSAVGDETGGTVEPLLDAPRPAVTVKVAPLDVDALFDEWWKVFPRRVEKQAAKKAFAKALKVATFHEILEGTRRYAAEVEGKAVEYVKYPSGWLNAGRWADETQEQTQARLGAPVNERRRHDTGRFEYDEYGDGESWFKGQDPVNSPTPPPDDPWAAIDTPHDPADSDGH